MENGVDVFVCNSEGESQRVGDVSAESVVQADELKDLEAEEVFQEAVEPQEHFDDQGSESFAVDAVVDKDDDAETGIVLTSALPEESQYAAQEQDSFEAIGIASESRNQDETEVIANRELESEEQGLDSDKMNGVDSGGAGDGASSDESHSMKDENSKGSSSTGGKEVSGLNTDGELLVKENGTTVVGSSGLVNEKALLDNSEYMTPREIGGLILENGSTDEVDHVVAESNMESESSEVVADQGTDAGDLKDSGSDPEVGDDNIEVQLDVSGVNPSSDIQDDSGEEVHDNPAETNLDHQHEVIRDMNGDSFGTDIIQENKNGEGTSISGIQSTELRDYGNENAEMGSDSEHQEAISEIRGASPPELDETVQEREDVVAAGSSTFLENSSTDETLSVQSRAADHDNSLVVHEPERVQESERVQEPERAGPLPVHPASPPEPGETVLEREAAVAAGSSSFLENYSPDETLPVQSRASDHDNSSMVHEPESGQAQEPERVQAQEPERVQAQEPERVQVQESERAGPPPVHPAGLGRAAPLLEPASRVVQQPRVNGTLSNTQSHQMEDSSNGEAEEYDETREKLQMIRVKFLRLARRLGQTPHNVVVAQVLYRLGLAEQLRGGNGGRVGAFSFDRASAMAEQLEAAGQEPLDFSCTIMVLGKTGVGKSATINSIFDEMKFNTSAFHMGTKKVQDVVGTVQGIKVRVIDTPGLLPSWSDQRSNEKILHSVKHFIKKTPPDIVLYLDRLDMQSRDFSDMPLLRTITEIFGPSIWFNAIVVLTHAASAPPDGPNGTASSYDMFVTQRSHVVQQAIRQAAGDMRLMNPVSLVENHSACRTNRAGQRVLPNGQVWKPHLLLLSFASKILAEANALLRLQDSPPGKPFTARARVPPLPFLLSTLLQSRPQLKLPEDQFGDEDNLDDDLDESLDSDDETDLDELPPFKPLTKAQVAKLSKAQKKAYFDEIEYREKLLMKKQLKEEKKRRKMMKKMAESVKDLPSDYSENVEEESSSAASVPVPMPDLALPASFDSDNPTHRYRYLDSSNQWLVRPVLETHGWDHDVGYEGLNVERLFVLSDKIPLSFSGQVTKDKKDANVQMEIAGSVKHGEGKATSLGFDMQTVGKDLAYTLRSETRFCNFRRNKATAGLSFTLLGDALSAGMKIEDKLVANKRFKLVVSGGAMAGRGDIAYGGSLEAQLRDKDYPIGRSLSTLGVSVMDWHGDLAVGWNVQSQIPVGRHTNLVARANLNNRGAGQISIRLNSSEQLQIALIGLIPLIKKLVGYPQQVQFGQW